MYKSLYNAGVSTTGATNYTVQAAAADAMLSEGQQMKEHQILKDFKDFKDFIRKSKPCDACINVKLFGSHDPRVNNRRRCQLCNTLCPGLEPDNDRRGAIKAQKEKERK